MGNYSLFPSSVNTTTASMLAWTTKGFYQPVDMNDLACGTPLRVAPRCRSSSSSSRAPPN